MSLLFNQEAFGLDISESDIKVAKLEKNKTNYSLVSWGHKDIMRGIVDDGEIKRLNDLVQVLKDIPNFVKGKKLSTKYVALALPEEETFLRVIKLPKMGDEQAKKAAIFEAENHIPMPLSDVYIDCEVFQPKGSNYTEALIVATPRKIVDDYAQAIEQAGFIPAIFESENQAVARSIIKGNYSKEPVLIVDIGETRTNFSILAGETLKFGGIIAESLNNFDKAIQESLKVDLKTAKDLRNKYGFSSDGDAAQNIYKAMEPIVLNLARQVNKYADYYAAKKDEGENFSISKIILCGEGASLKNIEKIFAANLIYKCEIGNPWVNIVSEKWRQLPTMQYNESLGFATVLGLSLRGINLSQEKYD